MLRKILLYLLFTLILSFKINAQNKITIDNTNYNVWIQCSESGYGRSSFFLATTQEYSNYLYYYKIYLYNNSFNFSGFEVPTYLEGIKVSAYTVENGKYTWKNILNIEYALIKPKSLTYDGSYYLGYIYSSDPNQMIKITWDKIHNF